MKTIIAIFFGIALNLSAAPTTPGPVTWGLTWDQPTNMPISSVYIPGTNQAYEVYSTQTLGTPLPAWPKLTTFTSWTVITNGNGSITLSNNVTLPFGQAFFYLNPTNIFGSTPFLYQYGAIVQTGPAWSPANNAGIAKQSP